MDTFQNFDKEIEKTIKTVLRAYTSKLANNPELFVYVRPNHITVKILTDNEINSFVVFKDVKNLLKQMNMRHHIITKVVKLEIITKHEIRI